MSDRCVHKISKLPNITVKPQITVLFNTDNGKAHSRHLTEFNKDKIEKILVLYHNTKLTESQGKFDVSIKENFCL